MLKPGATVTRLLPSGRTDPSAVCHNRIRPAACAEVAVLCAISLLQDDGVLWEVLKKVGLESQAQHAGGLDGHVDGTGGKAWSLGQMQLVCLARAALRAVPILCLDEATAAMDPHTEQIVQDTIKKVFSDRTTITIAHRLDTIIESDKVGSREFRTHAMLGKLLT